METTRLPLPLLVALGLAQAGASGCRTRCSPCLRLTPPTEERSDSEATPQRVSDTATDAGSRREAIQRVMPRVPDDVAAKLAQLERG